MVYSEIVDLSSDDEIEMIDVKPVKLEPGLVGMSKACDSEEEVRSPNGQSSTSVLDEERSPVKDTTSLSSAPLCRQFWKSGNYDDVLASNELTLQSGKNYLHIHPMFLHSNATSHKWSFGAIAELLDNAVDEIQNGATVVNVDKTTNPRDGSPALLIQDDGGGMDSEAMRRCMSFGFSEKKSKSAIGKYGNGFKTSSMRLGADVIVFSRHKAKRKMTQSIGLLSYTFLTQTGHERIVVPMVDYEFSVATKTFEPLSEHGKEHFKSNLSVMLQWSPFSGEAELLKQFNDIGDHGTKVIVYNLWLNDDGNVELDFDIDPKDIRIGGDTKKVYTVPAFKELNEQHMGNRFNYSLRVYLSILYLRIPESFRIILRGGAVKHHAIIDDLKFRELIMYRPQSGGCVEGEIITTIGFLNDAPNVNIHGFNVYHKNRLILPFWQVVSYLDSRGRGVVGVLEANFIEPTHNKQDFERTSLFQKLENRLKEMTWEYWDYHCGLIGYLPKKKLEAVTHDSPHFTQISNKQQPIILNKSSSLVTGTFSRPADNSSCSVGRPLSNDQRKFPPGVCLKRVELGHLPEPEKVKRQAIEMSDVKTNPPSWELQNVNTGMKDREVIMQENKKLRSNCLEQEKRKEELENKVTKLRSELGEVQRRYAQMLAELNLLCAVKAENNVATQILIEDS